MSKAGELKNSRLPLVYWALLFGFFITFHEWIDRNYLTPVTSSTFLESCWPHWTGCSAARIFAGLPESYANNGLFAAYLALMASAAFFAWNRRWKQAISVMHVLFAIKAISIFLLSARLSGNFHHYHLFMTAIFLFARQKVPALKLGVVLFYFVSSFVKLDEAWILGRYFLSLEDGMLGLPPWIVVLLCNFVIFLEMIMSWWLLSPNRQRRIVTFAILAVFHIFSSIYVGFFYPIFCLPLLFILFCPGIGRAGKPIAALRGRPEAYVLMLGCLAQIGFVGFDFLDLVPGQATRYGLYMFKNNHQCITEIRFEGEVGPAVQRTLHSVNGFNRCFLTDIYAAIKKGCDLGKYRSASWSYEQSINGGPFYRIVEEPDICSREFSFFRRNEWIKLPGLNAPVTRFPKKNLVKVSRIQGVDQFFQINDERLFKGTAEEFEAYMWRDMPRITGQRLLLLRLALALMGLCMGFFRFRQLLVGRDAGP